MTTPRDRRGLGWPIAMSVILAGTVALNFWVMHLARSDPSFAVGTARYQRPGGDGVPAHAHFLGGAVALWCTWVTAITLGATLGTHLPAGLHLELIVPLFLIGEVVPRMTTRAMRRATAVGAVVALAAGALPLRLGPVAAMVAGVVAGLTTKEAGR